MLSGKKGLRRVTFLGVRRRVCDYRGDKRLFLAGWEPVGDRVSTFIALILVVSLCRYPSLS